MNVIVNKNLRTVTANVLGGFFDVTAEKCGIEADRYKFPEYCTVLDGIMGLCKTYGCKLMIRNAIVDQKLKVILSITQRINRTLSANAFKAKTTVYNRGINHLICRGKGEDNGI